MVSAEQPRRVEGILEEGDYFFNEDVGVAFEIPYDYFKIHLTFYVGQYYDLPDFSINFFISKKEPFGLAIPWRKGVYDLRVDDKPRYIKITKLKRRLPVDPYYTFFVDESDFPLYANVYNLTNRFQGFRIFYIEKA